MKSLKMKSPFILRYLGVIVLIIIVFKSGLYLGSHRKNEGIYPKTLKFMKQEELEVSHFLADPIDSREFAWDSEDVPHFIVTDYEKAKEKGYDGVEYSFGENQIYVEKESMKDIMEINVNMDLWWSMRNFSIYTSGENIVIYGYRNQEFICVTLGKTQESIVKEVITYNPDVPFSADGEYISDEDENGCIFVISKDMKTVSAYKERTIIGEAIVLPNEILAFYDGTMILAKADNYTDKLYLPCIVNNNGKEEFVCPEVATVTAEEVENVSDTEYIDTFQSYTTNYSARMGGICCYIFENDDGMMRMLVPNSIQRYTAYKRGTDILKPEDDLGWHWITIN